MAMFIGRSCSFTALIIFCCLWMTVKVETVENFYETFEVEDYCEAVEVYYLGSNITSAVKLEAYNKVSSNAKTVYCNFTIKPPNGQGVILHLEHFKLDDPVKDVCHWAFLNISSKNTAPISMCGTQPEGTSIYLEDAADCYFYAENLVKHKSFTLVATAYTKVCTPDSFLCANKRCIWKGLVQDGVNNCGDYSDEFLDEPDESIYDNTWEDALFFTALAGMLLLLALLSIFFIRRRYLNTDQTISSSESVIELSPA